MKFLGKTITFYKSRTSLVHCPGGADGKASACNVGGIWVRFLGQEDALEKEMTTLSSTLAWKTPWMEDMTEYSPWGRKEPDTTE